MLPIGMKGIKKEPLDSAQDTEVLCGDSDERLFISFPFSIPRVFLDGELNANK
jgi:hypothetical protein